MICVNEELCEKGEIEDDYEEGIRGQVSILSIQKITIRN